MENLPKLFDHGHIHVFQGGCQTTEAWFVHLLQDKMQVPWRVFAKNSLVFMPVVRQMIAFPLISASTQRDTPNKASRNTSRSNGKPSSSRTADNLSFGLRDDRSKLHNRPREDSSLHLRACQACVAPEGQTARKDDASPKWQLGPCAGKVNFFITSLKVAKGQKLVRTCRTMLCLVKTIHLKASRHCRFTTGANYFC